MAMTLRLTEEEDLALTATAERLGISKQEAAREAIRVFVDEREAYKSPPIRGGMPPTPLSVDVRGGKRLSLIVDFGERGDELDHADWLDARLVD